MVVYVGAVPFDLKIIVVVNVTIRGPLEDVWFSGVHGKTLHASKSLETTRLSNGEDQHDIFCRLKSFF